MLVTSSHLCPEPESPLFPFFQLSPSDIHLVQDCAEPPLHIDMATVEIHLLFVYFPNQIKTYLC